MKYDYNICNQADEDIFEKQCKALERNIPNIVKSELLIDVDETQIQKYKINNSEIIVYNDYNIDAIYIKSDVELEQYFN